VTTAERVRAVAQEGFTDRQAGFLVTVMLHSGVCIGRQYCVYARIVRGQKVYDFFASLRVSGRSRRTRSPSSGPLRRLFWARPTIRPLLDQPRVPSGSPSRSGASTPAS
jgi:hypothetical protein